MWTLKTPGDLRGQVDIFLMGGGDPELGAYNLQFNKKFFDQVVEKVHDGDVIYMGRSGGAMAAGTDVGLSGEFMPNWHHIVAKGDTGGLSLVQGIVRPHYSFASWDAASLAYGVIKGYPVLRIPNGEGVICQQFEYFEVHNERNWCRAIGDADYSPERASDAALTKYYGLGGAAQWSDIANVVDSRWGNQRLGDVIDIRPSRLGFSDATAHDELLLDGKTKAQGYSGAGCLGKVLSKLPWAQQCTWKAKTDGLLAQQDLRADHIACTKLRLTEPSNKSGSPLPKHKRKRRGPKPK
jgi:hypothetical protein